MYAISAGHEETARAAEMILEEGGNAIDAAIAAFVASWVAEPCMSSAGGGGFAMAFGKSGQVKLFDFFVQTPKRHKSLDQLDFYPIGIDFGSTIEKFHIGKASTAVPGSVAGIFALHRFAGTMPMRDLVQPAIEIAKRGVVINNFQLLDFQLLEPILKKGGSTGDKLYFPKGALIQKGDSMKMEALADFLDYLSRAGEEMFYKGEIAKKIAADYANGGLLQRQDFEDYKVQERIPLNIQYRGKQILTNPGPSLGGSCIAAILSAIETKSTYPKNYQGREQITFLYDVLSQMTKVHRTPEALWRFVERQLRTKRGNTTHFNVVDKDGNAVSLTSTNGEGNGYFIEHTDIQMNNMMGEAALLPMGFHNWEADTRLSSMMAPTMVLGADQFPEIVLGSGGAGRIASAIAQVIHLLMDHHLPLKQAVNTARVHLEDTIYNIEKGFEQSSIALGHELNWWNETSLYFGGVHSLQKKDGRWLATGDDRRDGVAKVG